MAKEYPENNRPCSPADFPVTGQDSNERSMGISNRFHTDVMAAATCAERSTRRIAADESAIPLVVTFLDRNILEQATIDELRAELYALVSGVQTDFIFDLGFVKYMSSAVMSTLLFVNQKIKNKGGSLRFRGLIPEVKRVFEITKLDSMFMFE